MSDRVPADLIERVVGAWRHATRHIIRGDDGGAAYLMHSRECVSTWDDLRDCPWSIALDRGYVWLPDGEPHHVYLIDGSLAADHAPVPADERFSEAALGGDES